MKITAMPLGMIQANCYIVSSEQRNAVVIDPGGDTEKIIRCLQDEGLTLKMILLTHGHHDHVAAVWELLKVFSVPVYIHREDEEMLKNISISLCGMVPLYFYYDKATNYQLLSDGDQLKLDELTIMVIHTPGHSKGSSCFAVNEEALFSGDTLFEGGIGRYDLYGGSYKTLKESLKILADLQTDYRVYPGHGGATTLFLEKQNNPYMGQVTYDDYF